MIKHLTLTNFQCHEKLALDLDRGVTTLVGPSDSGKSAILRGLYWLFFNRPRGDSFVRDGATHCVVSVELETSEVVRRTRATRKNCYEIDDQLFDCVRGDVPEDVMRLLDVNESQFQKQIDPPFWLCLSPSQLSEELNELVDLRVLDRAFDSVASALRRLRQQEEDCSGRLRQSEQRRDELDWCVLAQDDLCQLKRVRAELDDVCLKYQRLLMLCDKLAHLEDQRQLVSEARQDLEALCARAQQLAETTTSCERLGRLLDRLSELHRARACAGAVADFEELDRLTRDARALRARRVRLQQLLDQHDELSEQRCAAQTETEKLSAMTLRLKDIVCPTCGRRLNL